MRAKAHSKCVKIEDESGGTFISFIRELSLAQLGEAPTGKSTLIEAGRR